MALYDCTCYRAWYSILPPPPCPIHEPSRAATYMNFSILNCRGRHCDHDPYCYGRTYRLH